MWIDKEIYFKMIVNTMKPILAMAIHEIVGIIFAWLDCKIKLLIKKSENRLDKF